MKKIFRFLGVSVFLLALIGQSFAQKVYVDGQVRYGFELKQLTAAEAQQALDQHYIDLWTYACFDENFIGSGAGHIVLNGDGTISMFNIAIGEATHSYKIVDKNGNDDQTGSVAMFARPADNTCSFGRENVFQDDIEFTVPINASIGHTPVQKVCPTWAYSSSSRTTGLTTSPDDVAKYCTIIEAEGKKWYCLKLYLMRFEYKQAKSFYVTFYSGSAADGVTSNGASNFNVFANGTFTRPLVWTGQTGDAQSWEFSGRYGFIRGGVEIIADPEFILTASATCGGSDLQGSFKVNNWNGKSWSDYKTVKMYVNTNGGTRKDITAQTAVTPSLPLNTSSTTADFNYTLASSAYMMNGAPADSLIWAFEEEKMMFI